MALVELRSKNCCRRVIINDRQLGYGKDLVFCPYCKQPIGAPQGE